ncbi:ABC transporter permease [Haloarcula litorea]|uniref:ABC transporter permease n=1 Tax=Haloarcula litorea TaxID=3032579 RepID=UPI0023E8D3C9|nr:ABC transporter permease [Halomicroarcula sp. GDY20]
MESALSRRLPLAAFAWENLTRAKARTVLAMAGITIGVVALASLGMFGAAFEQSQLNTVDDVTQTVWVTPGDDAEFQQFQRDHVDRIEQSTDDPVYTLKTAHAEVTGLRESTDASVHGLSDPRSFVTVRDGRLPSAWRSGAAVGPELADTLDVGVGDSVTVDGETHRVVAVLESTGRSSLVQTDDAVLLPQSQVETGGYSTVMVRADSPAAAFETSDELDARLNGRKEVYAVQDAESAIQRFRSQMATIDTFLLGIGGVSLLVAAVSILNVMLMSTIERKGEIGVLRAVGYRRLDVLRLLLYESMLLGVVGAVLGVGVSVLLGMLINAQLLSDPLAFTAEALTYTLLGFAFGTVASFLSGLYPAWKAANARPVEALRD